MIAQTGVHAENTGGAIVWIVVMLSVILAGAGLVGIVRRWSRSPGKGAVSVGLSLGAFQKLHERGELSDEEYAAIKRRYARLIDEQAEDRAERVGAGQKDPAEAAFGVDLAGDPLPARQDPDVNGGQDGAEEGRIQGG